MPVKRTYKDSEIRKTQFYRELAEDNRYDVTDPVIDNLVCHYAWIREKGEECRALIDSNGMIVEGAHGGDAKNPAITALKDFSQMSEGALNQLKKLTAVKPEQADSLTEFLEG